METIEVDGLAIAYERAGHGPPLVLLLGSVGDGPTTWRRQLDGLCDDFTVVARGGRTWPGCRSAAPSPSPSTAGTPPSPGRWCWRPPTPDGPGPCPPRSTLVVLPDAAHVCNIEAPEAFNQAVRSFLWPLAENSPFLPLSHLSHSTR